MSPEIAAHRTARRALDSIVFAVGIGSMAYCAANGHFAIAGVVALFAGFHLGWVSWRRGPVFGHSPRTDEQSMTPETFSTEHTSDIVCPYCGHADECSYEWDPERHGPDGDGSAECGDCGREFNCSRHVVWTYTTSKKANDDT